MIKRFTIKQPYWMLKYFVTDFSISISWLIAVITLHLNSVISFYFFTALFLMGSACLIAGIIGTLCFNAYKFSYSEGFYYYKRPLRKEVSIKVSHITRVEIVAIKSLFAEADIFFYSGDKILLAIKGDGWIFNNEVFITSLTENNIEVEKKKFKRRPVYVVEE